jgi:hypothetical protein
MGGQDAGRRRADQVLAVELARGMLGCDVIGFRWSLVF